MPRKCKIKPEILSLYFMGEGSPWVRRKVERHLQACPACKEYAARREAMGTACERLNRIDVTSDYHKEFNRRLQEANPQAPSALRAGIDRIGDVLGRIASIIPPVITELPVPALATVAALALFSVAVSAQLVYVFSPPPCSIVLSQGDVKIYDGMAGRWNDASAGLRLAKHTQIETAGPASIDIEMAEKYAFRLSGEGSLSFTDVHGTRKKSIITYTLNKGILMAYTKDGFSGSELNIKTAYGTAVVTGTEFMVDAQTGERVSLAVLEGAVTLRGVDGAATGDSVVVEEGFESAVSRTQSPVNPYRYGFDRACQLMEIRNIGLPPRIASSVEVAEKIKYKDMVVTLIVPETADRADRLLADCAYWTNDREPGHIKKLLEESRRLTLKGQSTNDKAVHRQAIEKFDKILRDYPDDRYNPQFLMFTGIYYRFLGMFDNAIENLQMIVDDYSYTELASIAQYIIGVIYEEDKGNTVMAKTAYDKVIADYPDSPEAASAQSRLSQQTRSSKQ